MAFYRRNLPHWHPEGKAIFITWRLYKALPAALVKKLRGPTKNTATQPAGVSPEEVPRNKFLQLDSSLDSAKSGPVWLLDPEFADYAEYPIHRGAELGR